MTPIAELDMHSRRLPISGTYNVRDIGGYKTKDGRTIAWRRVLRGDAIHKVDDAGREIFQSFNLSTSLDLREEDERTEAPDNLNASVKLVSVPVFTYSTTEVKPVSDRKALSSLDEVYKYVIAERGVALVAALRELAQPDALPVIVHCTAGKDRTGIVIALLLASLGVPDDVIAADFAATSLFLTQEFFEGITERAVNNGQDRQQYTAMLKCEPSLILNVLKQIRDSHEDVSSYLIHHGMPAEELDRLRLLILESVETPEAVNESTVNNNEGVTHV